MTDLQTKDDTISFREYWKQALIIMFILGAVFFTVSAFLPPKYKSNASILIIQKDASGLDAYKETKSAEFSGRVLKEIIHSNSFMETVIQSLGSSKAYFEDEKKPEERLEKWRDNVTVDQVTNTGILNIASFADDKTSSREIISKIIDTLHTQGKSFYGNEQLEIKVINKPYTLEKPAFPNLLVNTLIGVLLGALLVFTGINIKGRSFIIFGAGEKAPVDMAPREPISFKSAGPSASRLRQFEFDKTYSDEKYVSDFQKKFGASTKSQTPDFVPVAPKTIEHEEPLAEKPAPVKIVKPQPLSQVEAWPKEPPRQEQQLSQPQPSMASAGESLSDAFEKVNTPEVETPTPTEEKKPKYIQERIAPSSTVSFGFIRQQDDAIMKQQLEVSAEEPGSVQKQRQDNQPAREQPQKQSEPTLEKKATAPVNLPVAEDENIFTSSVSMPASDKAAQTQQEPGRTEPQKAPAGSKPDSVRQTATQEEANSVSPAMEPTDEEIKQRLNKLLKGEL